MAQFRLWMHAAIELLFEAHGARERVSAESDQKVSWREATRGQTQDSDSDSR